MAISKTVIANLALTNIHAKSNIENVDTETSTEAKKSKLWYDVARQQALKDGDWGFARKRMALATHGEDAPTQEWAYRYQWPSDCIAPRWLERPGGTSDDAIPFDYEYADDGTLSIVTDLSEARLVYTFDLADPTFFSPHFVVSLSYLLGHYLAGVIAGKMNFKEKMLQSYYGTLSIANASDANMVVARKAREAEHIRGR